MESSEAYRRRWIDKNSGLGAFRRRRIDKNNSLEALRRRWIDKNSGLKAPRSRWIDKNSSLEGPSRSLPTLRQPPTRPATAIPDPPKTTFSNDSEFFRMENWELKLRILENCQLMNIKLVGMSNREASTRHEA